MGYQELFNNYFVELNNVTELLNKYVNAYRLLIGGAQELNIISEASKRDIKDALDRVDKLGKVIDHLIDVIEGVDECYIDFIKLKTDLISAKTEKKLILTEIDNELFFQNETKVTEEK